MWKPTVAALAVSAALLAGGVTLAPAAGASEGEVSFASAHADIANPTYVPGALARFTLDATLTAVEGNVLPPNPVVPPNPSRAQLFAEAFRTQVRCYSLPQVAQVTPIGRDVLQHDIDVLLPPNPILPPNPVCPVP